MEKTNGRPVVLMTLIQVVCGLLMLLTMTFFISSALAVIPNYMMMNWLNLLESSVALKVLLALEVIAAIVVGVCLLIVEMQVFHVCGVVKRFSAFSPVTERSLGRIVRALGVMAAVLVPLGLPVMEWLTTGLPALFVPLAALLPAFAAATLMAMVRVVQLLLRRAIELQDEADLTV